MKKINKYKLNPSEKLYASAIEEFLNYGSPKHKARILIETCDKDSLRMHVKSIYEQRYGLLDINQPNRDIFHMILSEDYASRKLAFDLCMHYAIYSDILLFCIYYLFNYNVCTLKEKIWYYLHNIEDRSIYIWQINI